MKPLVAFKHLFIPREENDYKPHFFRKFYLVALVTGGFFLLGVSAGSSLFIQKTVLGASVASSVLIDLTNESRIANNQEPLIKNDSLERAAQLKLEDMIKEGYFAHDSPSGTPPWHWLKLAGYNFLYAGENLAVNFFDSAEVGKAWLDSPAHRANILNPKFKEIGIATGEGVYKGKNTIFVVQMFGTQAKPVTPKKPVVPVVTSTTVKKALLHATSTQKAEVPIAVIPTKEPAFVVSLEENVVAAEVAGADKYATWYNRIVYGGSSYVDLMYKIVIFLIGTALVITLLIEVKKRHWKHIFYGIVALSMIMTFFYINREYFMTHFIF